MNPFLDKNISQFIIRYRDDIDRSLKFNKSKPISVSSDLGMSHKHNKKKINSSEITSVEKISRKKPSSLHTNADERKEQRQISRIPIEYYQQRDTGSASDKVRGRVVYRGYAPKNTYFYFKTIKELRFNNNQNDKLDKDYRGEDVIFNSKFQSGNLHSAVRINSRQYWLYMRQDTNTHGLRQWYFFQMRVRRDCKIKLRIYKFTKRFSLYKCGMKPFVKTSAADWKQNGINVCYLYDSDQKCFYLEFQYQFQAHNDTYFATLPPYTYSNLNDYLQTISYQEKISIKKIGSSLSGLDITSISIIDKNNSKEDSTIKQKIEGKFDTSMGQSYTNPKQAIIILCRTHPAETASNFTLQSFISRILQLNQLTEKYCFYIIPMINPDGVYVGNHRTGILGQDFNRKFTSLDLQYFPEVEIVENFVINIQKKHKIAFLFDLHGHSAKKNIFAYGQQAQIGTSKYLLSRVIPKILSNTIDSFKYDYCVFKSAKEKQNTARVYFSKKNGINSLTFEQSYGLLDVGMINVCHWRNFGIALADALLQFQSFSSSNLLPQISTYMSEQMDRQRETRLNRQKKKRQLLLLQQQQALKANKAITMKTQFNEQIVKNVVHQLLHKKKTENAMIQNDAEYDNDEQMYDISEDEELSSGDESMQITNQEFEQMKKDIVRVGVINREITRRQILNMAEKKVELGNYYVHQCSQRLHHKNSAVVQRIFKFKSRQKGRDGELFASGISNRDRQKILQLPYLRK